MVQLAHPDRSLRLEAYLISLIQAATLLAALF
jgi:DNA-binding TFAR19-related protein (PDSD5 family)